MKNLRILFYADKKLFKEKFLELSPEKRIEAFKGEEIFIIRRDMIPLFFNNIKIIQQEELLYNFPNLSEYMVHSFILENYKENFDREKQFLFFKKNKIFREKLVHHFIDGSANSWKKIITSFFKKLDIFEQERIFKEEESKYVRRSLVSHFFKKLNLNEQLRLFREETDESVKLNMIHYFFSKLSIKKQQNLLIEVRGNNTLERFIANLRNKENILHFFKSINTIKGKKEFFLREKNYSIRHTLIPHFYSFLQANEQIYLFEREEDNNDYMNNIALIMAEIFFPKISLIEQQRLTQKRPYVLDGGLRKRLNYLREKELEKRFKNAKPLEQKILFKNEDAKELLQLMASIIIKK